MHVIHYYPWGGFEPATCGADVVAVNQVDYFRERGWTVDLVTPASCWRSGGPEAFLHRYSWANHITLFDVPPSLLTYRLPDMYFAYLAISRQPLVREALQRDADLFFANYVFTAPLLDPLPRSCPRLVETHDLHAHQFALYDGHQEAPGERPAWLSRAKREYLFRLEVDLLRLFDTVLMITADDLATMCRAGLKHACHVPPQINPVAAAGASLSGQAETDLLFVAADNPYNVAAIEWFFRRVYLPYLARHRVRLTVAGQVCRRLHLAAHDLSLLGMVPGPLHELYASSRLVIAPMLEGTGISVKTLDAMAHARAVVATPVGRRGVDPDSEALVCVDMEADPAQAAAVILDLLAADRQRQALGAAAQDYIRQRHSRAAYFHAMDQVVEHALHSRASSASLLRAV